jgi:hypothetical protein
MVTGFGKVNWDIIITRPFLFKANGDVIPQHRDSLGRFDAYARNPILKKDLRLIREQLIYNIQNRKLITQGRKSSPPYHTYPTETFGDLENKAYANKKGKNMIVIGSKSKHASILETGRKKITSEQEEGLTFRGYYPNKKILMAILNSHIRIP